MKQINCAQIDESYIGQEVGLYGWCRMVRDHGGKLFIDIADRYGMSQLVFDGKLKAKADQLKREYVIYAKGKVRKREPDTVDKSNKTGTVEIMVEHLELVNQSLTPPFELITEKNKFLADEEIRLKYRYLDLRREAMIKNVLFRDHVTKTVRRFLWDEGFLELETPFLVKDTYETGSRTFLVPSRLHKGKMYSLQQSPQVYKQLCMVAGLDKYFQIARCFRDEDAREDRQPEFTQIDIEVSFRDEKYLLDLIERMLDRIFKEALHKELKLPIRHLSYPDAIQRYGSDKPDLRYDMELKDLTKELEETEYQIIKRVIKNGGKVRGICFNAQFGDQGSKINTNYMLRLIENAKALGLGGLTWLYVKNGRISSDPAKIADSIKSAHNAIISKFGAKDGDVIIMGSDLSEALLLNVLGRLRKQIGDMLGIFKEEYSFAWIEGFPLFEKDEVTNKLKPGHNPFSAPTAATAKYLEADPSKVLARQYDLVLNGYEIGGGSIRINDPEMQRNVLRKMDLDDDTIERVYGFLIEALSFGAPIHGGIAIGFDRLVANLMHTENIREFILFPKNKKQELLLDGSPTKIDDKRLKDDYYLHIEPPK